MRHRPRRSQGGAFQQASSPAERASRKEPPGAERCTAKVLEPVRSARLLRPRAPTSTAWAAAVAGDRTRSAGCQAAARAALERRRSGARAASGARAGHGRAARKRRPGGLRAGPQRAITRAALPGPPPSSLRVVHRLVSLAAPRPPQADWPPGSEDTVFTLPAPVPCKVLLHPLRQELGGQELDHEALCVVSVVPYARLHAEDRLVARQGLARAGIAGISCIPSRERPDSLHSLFASPIAHFFPQGQFFSRRHCALKLQPALVSCMWSCVGDACRRTKRRE